MRQDFFEYIPQFKLLIAGNHKPSLRSVDEAIRRRFHLIPFKVTIPPSERDLDLPEKLKAEGPGILQWMIEGCLLWQERGLDPPEVVRVATATYLESEDTFAVWMDECCDRDPRAWERTQDLFASWKAWAERSGDYVGNQKTFKAKLETRDGIAHRLEPGTGRAGYQGIALKRAEHSEPYWNRE